MNQLKQNNLMQIEEIPNKVELSLHMYDVPPTEDYSLSAICKISEDRIRILKGIQSFFENRKEDLDLSMSFYDSLAAKLTELKMKYNILNNTFTDNISHWILKLTFTNSPTDEHFFYFYEKILFAARLFTEGTAATGDKNLTKEQIEEHRSNFFFEELCKYAEKPVAEASTLDCFKKVNGKYIEVKEKFIPVPFRFAMKALESYDADLQNGKALITPYTSFIVLQELFEETLTIHKENLQKVSGFMLKSEPRLLDIINSLKAFKTNLDNTAEIYYDRKERFSGVSYDNIQNMAAKHFPLCMLEIHDNFKQVHSLKHWGRLQFGMFLKGIGMDIKDTVRLFSNELKKTAQGEKKVKEYQYYIEHMYGKQGKKTDYTPWGCQKIAGKSIPSGNEVYGCPFKFYSDKVLKSTLQRKKGLNEEDIDEILSERRADFTLGCKKLFEKTHPNGFVGKGIGKHPNSYFSTSYWHFNKPANKTHFGNLTKVAEEPHVAEQ